MSVQRLVGIAVKLVTQNGLPFNAIGWEAIHELINGYARYYKQQKHSQVYGKSSIFNGYTNP